ncbi:hypothetical protein HRbin17_02238 [bacterium HR17]|uniref:Uncharacterized protein n=1 Tax=Candidatus Fervidibacter japonicus TaxID=2035412 RepID=A0A2H5XEZ1_9BACT|nr:hypothetical protein HRbin17_02238 [bacterium HR17]
MTRRCLSSAAQKSRPPKNLQHSEGASLDAPLSLFGGSKEPPSEKPSTLGGRVSRRAAVSLRRLKRTALRKTFNTRRARLPTRRCLSSAAQKNRPPKNLQHLEGASLDAPLSPSAAQKSRPPSIQHSSRLRNKPSSVLTLWVLGDGEHTKVAGDVISVNDRAAKDDGTMSGSIAPAAGTMSADSASGNGGKGLVASIKAHPVSARSNTTTDWRAQ